MKILTHLSTQSLILLVLLSSQLITLPYKIEPLVAVENKRIEAYENYTRLCARIIRGYANKYNTPYEIIEHIHHYKQKV